MKAYYEQESMAMLCGLFGKTRQAFYDRKNRIEKQLIEDVIIIDLVKRERKIARRVGAKKLYQILKPELLQHHIKMGRDKFFDLLRSYGLLVPSRRKRKKTTYSRHKLRKYPNKSKELVIDKAEILWVSDLTYIRLHDGFAYLILITDAYSRKVVGHNFSKTMEAAFCVTALKNAIAQRQFPTRKLMHHSDRGLQYCSAAYVETLKDNNISISMTENGDPLENALAERMNRIFKDNFDIARTFDSFEQAEECINKAIKYYNNRLPHSSCDMLTPEQAHLKVGELKRHWKKKQFKLTEDTKIVSPSNNCKG